MRLGDLLLDARRENAPMTGLPAELEPTTMDEAYFVQDQMALAYGEIGGWKIGAPNAEAEPFYGPMPRAWMAPSDSIFSGPQYRFRGIEAEIAFLVGKDLPPRETPYTREECIAAMASCHPAIEELESGFVDPRDVPRFASFADLQMNGGFVYGPAIANWQTIDFTKEPVVVTIDGTVRADKVGSFTSGDLLRLLPYLANEGAIRTGGLRAGQWITTGSWNGIAFATGAQTVDVTFAHAGVVGVRFE